MKTTKLMLTTILTLLLSTPFASFAGEGTNSGGGGDPQELLKTGLGMKYSSTRGAYLAFINQQKKTESVTEQRSRITAAVKGWAESTTELYQLLYAAGYFSTTPTLQSFNPNQLKAALTTVKVEVAGEFKMAGADGKERRALFSSNPQTQTMTVNLPYWNEIFSIARFKFLENGFKKRDASRLGQYIFDVQTIDLAIAGIMFHEALVLNNIEQSRSYPYSSVFTRTLQLTIAYGKKSLVLNGVDESMREVIQKLRPKLTYLDIHNIDPNYMVMSIFDLTHINVDDFEKGRVLIVSDEVARQLRQHDECFDKWKKMGQLREREKKLEREISILSAGLDTETDPERYDELRMKYAEKPIELDRVRAEYDALAADTACH